MARGQLFEYALLYHPKQTKDQADRGEWPKSEVIQNPVTTIGTEATMQMIAARAIPEKYQDKLEDVEIVVRPF